MGIEVPTCRPHIGIIIRSILMTPIRVRIFPILMAIFLIIPIIEIYLLMQVGGIIGVLPTIGLVVFTAVLGAAMLRTQGLQTYMRFNQSMAEGRVPAAEILEGVALLVGGALLLTPGFFTDAIGFLCLIGFTRRAVIKVLLSKFNPLANMQTHSFRPGHTPNNHSGNVYEGEVTSYQVDREQDKDS